MLLTLFVLALAASCQAFSEADFIEPQCNITYKSERAICTILIKCVTQHDKVTVKYKDQSKKDALYSSWQPGDDQKYNVTVFQGKLSKTYNYTFPFEQMCDFVMYMEKQYKLWPPTPQGCVENPGSFCMISLCVTVLALILTLLYLRFKSRQSFIDEKKMP